MKQLQSKLQGRRAEGGVLPAYEETTQDDVHGQDLQLTGGRLPALLLDTWRRDDQGDHLPGRHGHHRR